MKIFRTTAFQLTTLYALLLAVSTIAIGAVLYWGTIGFLYRQTDSTIEVEITGLREQYRLQGLAGLSRVIAERIRRGDDPEALYLFADRDLRPLAGNIPAWPELISREAGWYSFANEANGRSVPARARVLSLPEGLLLLVGRDISDLEQLLSLVSATLFWGAALLMVLSFAGGLFMSNQALKRVEHINETTREIITGDLSRRVQTRGTRDEFDQLAENVNRMLDRIEELMGGIRHVGDNIAHDLRTPLTRLRHALEEAKASGSPELTLERIDTAIADADQLLATFAALLRIARLESGGYSARKEQLLLAPIVEDAVEFYEAIADAKGIRIETGLDRSLSVEGDRDLLFQLLTNLLDNALKYTPTGGRVVVTVAKQDDGVRLTIADTGCGVAEAEREKILARFYRVDESRKQPGTGLGLSLVKAIVDYHGAGLALEDNRPGLRVSVVFLC